MQNGPTSSLVVVTAKNRKFLTTGGLTGLSGAPAHAPDVFTMCRQPARERVVASVFSLALGALGIVFVARRSGAETHRKPSAAPA